MKLFIKISAHAHSQPTSLFTVLSVGLLSSHVSLNVNESLTKNMEEYNGYLMQNVLQLSPHKKAPFFHLQSKNQIEIEEEERGIDLQQKRGAQLRLKVVKLFPSQPSFNSSPLSIPTAKKPLSIMSLPNSHSCFYASRTASMSSPHDALPHLISFGI